VLIKPNGQPSYAAQQTAARLKRQLRLKAITTPRSLWSPWIDGRLAMAAAKTKTLTEKRRFFFAMEFKEEEGGSSRFPGVYLAKTRAPAELRHPL
jgi:hypothetical protein